ncbi:MAG TPA: photosystem I reaction center subunit VIII [Cyanobacteria bacterium UBA11149]|nr:photosystem I reaction center subunit VIII [Cyanobacteria bacterium UBA11367]HBE57876.1 photosystem I reaction center subunit VIII [Cyanobacteria bacterium UBA11366]HBK63153.1 photosystem I reaction center subunit VIII [Cyanobacteria bacterium UBA11166]HBR74627.1 photosystem I reaction center subunit VIII [Cyanobacteria bacterium UBA11159]HBS70250.1 photosystem I reaction center subunit VIII [Cyanobacteria bacterium UBA11153]HBW91194.1 photosystem I reaction center subunit VIII [Cyanobacter
MTGAFAASFLPAVMIPLVVICAFVSMGLFFLYVEGEA